MFFSHDDNFGRGLDWYSNTFFKGSQDYPARGEASPHYLYWSEKTAPRIKATFQDTPIKFIVTLRDPVMRAYSWYGNMLKDGTEDLPFEQALEIEEQRINEDKANLYKAGSMQFGYFRGSCYASLLAPFLDLFPIQDFLFVFQDDVISDLSHMSLELFSFLGVNADFQLSPVRSNPAAVPISNKLHLWLRQRSKFKDLLKRLIPFELRYKLKVRVMHFNLKPARFPQLDMETSIRLRKRFESEIFRLQKITGRDLSTWLP
jgi:hypothetical protein